MYPHFIEVHQNGIPMMLNVDQIICASDKCDKKEWQSVAMVTGCSVDEAWGLDESYDELKELIRSAGCHIEKGDPRLDQSRPLTKEDIKEMGVGEPVWHSNKMLWGIITGWADLESGFYCSLVTHKSCIDMDEDDLVKYPLYRMKRNEDRIYIPDGYVREKLGSKNHD